MFPFSPPPGRGQPYAAEPLVGAGGLDVSGGVIRDIRPTGFYARITGNPSSYRYAFSRVDEIPFGGSNSFLPIDGFDAYGGVGAGGHGDGLSLTAFEMNGRQDVPADGTVVVWLEPLRGIAQYGFCYTPPPTPPLYGYLELPFSPLALAYFSGGDWQGYPPPGPVLAIPKAGYYLLWLTVTVQCVTADSSMYVEVSLETSTGGHVARKLIQQRVVNVFTETVSTIEVAYFSAPTTLRLVGQRQAPATGTVVLGRSVNNDPKYGYLRLGD